MEKETWIYSNKKNTWIKASKWDLFWNSIKRTLIRWKLVDTHKYYLIPWSDKKRQFILSDKEYIKAQNIYKEKGTISYEFYPCAGIGWGVKIHVLKTEEIIDVTDYNNW